MFVVVSITETVSSALLVTYILFVSLSYAILIGEFPTDNGACAATPIIKNGIIAINIPATMIATKNIELVFGTLAFTLFNIRQY